VISSVNIGKRKASVNLEINVLLLMGLKKSDRNNIYPRIIRLRNVHNSMKTAIVLMEFVVNLYIVSCKIFSLIGLLNLFLEKIVI